MRLIDADALPIRKAYIVDEAGFGATFYVVDVEDIDCSPTIDAVPVVRCKDCMYSRPIDREDSYEAFFDEDSVWCTIRDSGEYSMGFCYCPVRRTDAENH